eukprot:scaffold90267_cov35-Cyclotella_meneghiniana.AAC.1
MDLLAQAAEQAEAGQTTGDQTNVRWFNQGEGGSAFTAALLARHGQQGVNTVSPEQGTAQQRGAGGAGGEGAAGNTAQGEQIRAGTAGEDNTAGGNLFRIGEGGPHTPMARTAGAGQNLRLNLQGANTGGGVNNKLKGVQAALEKVLAGLTPEKLGEEYARQIKLGEAGKNDYKDEIIHQRSFKAHAYVQDKTTDIKVVFGLEKYYNGDVAVELKGKVLGRMGDRTEMGEPMVVKLPEQTAWSWKNNCVANNDLIQWGTFAEASEGNKWKLWQPPTTNVANINLPRMMGLPPDVALFLIIKKRTAMEGYMYVVKLEAEGKISAEQATPLKNWFLVAGQCVPGTETSPLAIEMSPVLNTDREFQRWAFEQANMMFGPKDQQVQTTPVQQGGMGGGAEFQQAMQQMTNVLKNMHQDQKSTIKEKKEEKKKEEVTILNEYDLAKLMGWSGEINPDYLQPIWQELLACKGEANRRNVIQTAMKEFAKKKNFKIDPSCFLSKQVLDDIIEQRPNETGVLASMEASGRGVSNMVVLGRTQAEIEAMLRQEEAMNRSDGNRTYREAEKAAKVQARKPPAQYFTLLLNVATFAALLRVLYGPKCDLFKQVWVIFQTLEMDTVFARKEAFTPQKCKEITWVIYEECRAFFRVLKTPAEFLSPEPVVFPEAGLQDVLTKIKRQEHIWSSTFPVAWRDNGEEGTEDLGGANQYSQGGGSNGGGNNGGGGGGRGSGGGRSSWYDGRRLGGTGGVRGGSGRPGAGGGGGRGGGQEPGEALKHVNPIILNAFPDFFAKYKGRVSIRNIMEAGGLTWDDMPKLPSVLNAFGGDGLCWAKIMGNCQWGHNCKFAGAHGVVIPDDFAREIVNKLRPGVENMMKGEYKFPSQLKREREGYAGGGPPFKRQA